MELEVSTSSREQLIDITHLINEKIKEVDSGLVHIFVPHATAAITLNENADPNLQEDIISYLRKQIPQGIWQHDKIDNNADAHIKSSIIGPEKTIPIKNGKLQLGTWQNVFLCEFDGPRKRKIILNIIRTA